MVNDKVNETPGRGMIYLASAYTDDDKQVMEARLAFLAQVTACLIERGIPVFSPVVVTAPFEASGRRPKNDATGKPGWYEWDLGFVEASSAVVVISFQEAPPSYGLRLEVELAMRLSIPILLTPAVSLNTEIDQDFAAWNVAHYIVTKLPERLALGRPNVLRRINAERSRQNVLHGPATRSRPFLEVLTEEVGEVAESLVHTGEWDERTFAVRDQVVAAGQTARKALDAPDTPSGSGYRPDLDEVIQVAAVATAWAEILLVEQLEEGDASEPPPLPRSDVGAPPSMAKIDGALEAVEGAITGVFTCVDCGGPAFKACKDCGEPLCRHDLIAGRFCDECTRDAEPTTV